MTHTPLNSLQTQFAAYYTFNFVIQMHYTKVLMKRWEVINASSKEKYSYNDIKA